MFMPADAGQILRQMSGIRLLLHPAHHAAQFLADLFDQVLGLHTALCHAIRCFGEYSYRISDPILFYTNVCGNVSEDYTRDRLDGQLKT